MYKAVSPTVYSMAPSKKNPSPSNEVSAAESDSDFPSTILPSKKKLRHPTPGSPNFKDLPAVTTSQQKADLAAVSRKLSFGNLSDGNGGNVPKLRSPANLDAKKRIRKPSEKAAYMASDNGDVSPDGEEETPRPKKPIRKDQAKGKEVLSSHKRESSSEVEVVAVNMSSQAEKSKSSSRSKSGAPSKATPHKKEKEEQHSTKKGGAKGKSATLIHSDSSEIEVVAVDGPPRSGNLKSASRSMSDALASATPLKKRKQVDRSPSVDDPSSVKKEPKKANIPAPKRLRLVPKSPEAPPSSKKSPETAHPVSQELIDELDAAEGIDLPSSDKKEPKAASKRLRLVPKSPEVPPSSQKSPQVARPVSEEPSDGLDAAEEQQADVTVEELEEQANNEVDDDLLREAYASLEHYPDCDLLPFGSATSGQGAPIDPTLLSFSPLLEALPKVAKRNFFNSVNFTACGQFINPTRDPTTSVALESDKLLISGTRKSAVLMTTGIVTECRIVEPTSNAQQVLVRKIDLIPLAYENRRLQNWLGARFGKLDLYTRISPDAALTFATRKEGAGRKDVPGSTNSSPKKGGAFFVKTKPPATPRATPSRPTTYPFFREFTETIPIYDARETRFRFDAQSFDNIDKLPLYNKDLDADAIVCVAYSVNSWAYAPAKDSPKTDTAVCFNVMFILFLGALPEETAQSDSE